MICGRRASAEARVHLAPRVTVLACAASLCLLVPGSDASAQVSADFRSRAELELSEPNGLHRFTLPFEAYRDARRDLSDLRVFNGADQPVPFALATVGASASVVDTVALPQFAVFAGREKGTESAFADINVAVRTRTDGTVISVQPRGRTVATDRPSAWLLDASAINRPIRALLVDWESGAGAEVVHVNIERSDDLRTWRPAAQRAALVRVAEGDRILTQPRVEFFPGDERYWRISASDRATPFVLRAVRAETTAEGMPATRETRDYVGTAGASAGEYVFDLGAWLPVDAVRVLFPEPNVVARVEVLSRDSDGDEWRRVTTGDFYRLTRNGVEATSPAQEISRRAHRYWMLRVDPRSGLRGSVSPTLQVSWRPAEVVFVAGGESPFSVAFGNPNVPGERTDLPISSLIPDYTRSAEQALPEARVGTVQTVALPGDGWRRYVGDVSGRTVALWSVLLAGVAFLGFMAWRLSRQLPGD